jgi:putative DNA methylase
VSYGYKLRVFRPLHHIFCYFARPVLTLFYLAGPVMGVCTMTAKKLIEVVMPIREVSAESVRDKSIRHGHISTLHLWWARRPLPVCRAVVFASLVPDPDDPACPPIFQEAVRQLLGPDQNPGDPYRPYDDIPYTAAHDPMADTLRNRLLMFIGKYSDAYCEHAAIGKADPPAGKLLSEHSLVKWETRRNPALLDKARKLIFVAHQTQSPASSVKLAYEANLTDDAGETLAKLTDDFNNLMSTVREAEKSLYQTPDRHVPSPDQAQKQADLQTAIDAFLDRMPRVFDPFAGGGAIPLEAARLGCRTFGNDINPVAHVIQRGSLEFPQRFGKPITYSKAEFLRLYPVESGAIDPKDKTQISTETSITVGSYADLMGQRARLFSENCIHIIVSNRLSFDVDYYARKLLAQTEAEVGHLYPKNGAGQRPIAYYWARTATCANPACRADVPLLKGFYLCDKPGKRVYLEPTIEGTSIEFSIKEGDYKGTGWTNKSSLICPCCGNTTNAEEIRRQLAPANERTRLLAVIDERIIQQTRQINGRFVTVETSEKYYRKPTEAEFEAIAVIESGFDENDRPTELLPNVTRLTGGFIVAWGYKLWGEMFSKRQLTMLLTLTRKLDDIKSEWRTAFDDEYITALATYLAIWIDRVSMQNTTFGRWHLSGEKLEHPFARQAIPMMLDYPESVPFCESTGSALNQLEWLIRYVEDEGANFIAVECRNASSGDTNQFPAKYLDAVVTDPPYYDAIAYADLSDFFYVWLKLTLRDIYPFNFAYPQTPKTEECTALKHHHDGKVDVAKKHFEQKLNQIFSAIEQQTRGVVSIMFAHQSTEAWTTLCNSVLGANMNITGSWAIDTEMANRSVGLAGAALESSVTVSCRPVERTSVGEYNGVRREISQKVAEEVELLYRLGFRGADLLTACFGQAVSVFGHYESVQKLSGEGITVAELLTLARESAFNSLVRGFEADDLTRFYLAWLQLYGFTESDFDEINKLTKVGLQIDTHELEARHLLVGSGNRKTLATYSQRTQADPRLGLRDDADQPVLDRAHRAMQLYASGDRAALITYLQSHLATADDAAWRVMTALEELLKGTDDHKQAAGLLTNKDSLLREARQKQAVVGIQAEIGF